MHEDHLSRVSSVLETIGQDFVLARRGPMQTTGAPPQRGGDLGPKSYVVTPYRGEPEYLVCRELAPALKIL